MMMKFSIALVLLLHVPLVLPAQRFIQSDRKEILVQLEQGMDANEWAVKTGSQFVPPVGLTIKKPLAPKFGYYLATFGEAPDREQFLNTLRHSPGVKSAQWNEALEFRGATPNDPLFPTQWDMGKIGLEDVWGISTGGTTPNGDEIVVAILDKGFDLSHEEFVGNLWINKGEIPGDGVDNDGNGRIDDLNGWDFRSNSKDFTAEVHGTGVAGIIGAKGDNDKGLAGVNWKVKMMFLGVEYADQVVSAFNYALEQRELYNATNGQQGAFVVVTNGSFGLDKIKCSEQPAWGAMYDPMGKVGILSVAATANENWDVDELGDIPTSCPSEYLITVTSTDIDDKRASTAAFGKTTIDLGAPGVKTTTTNTQNRYRQEDFSGTSSACPHVAGSIALLYSLPCGDVADMVLAQPDATARLIRDAIFKSVDPLESLNGKTATGGRLQVANAMKYLHSYCIARAEERASGNFQEIYFSEKGLVRMYPNPVSEQLILEYSTNAFVEVSVRIFNALGQEVRFPANNPTTPFNEQKIVIDVKDWPTGTYFISLVDKEKKIARAFVKL